MLMHGFEKYLLMYRHRFFYVLILFFVSLPTQALNDVSPTGIYDNNACVECHDKNNPDLVNDWRTSSHASTQPVTDCIACHGNLHKDTASTSRQDSACISCHGGKTDPAVHSYTTSKHGAIMQMEQTTYDWQQALANANYRAPGCSYCHLHEGDHNVNRMLRDKLVRQNNMADTQLLTQKVCQDCHAPRYITQLLDNGENMLEIALKKVNEADAFITQASVTFNEHELMPAKQIMKKMQQHLRNVYLGAAHQSPDYQWWHGQPALDGDLLRIKGLIGKLHRNKNLETH